MSLTDIKSEEWFVFHNDMLLLKKEANGSCRIPYEHEIPQEITDEGEALRVTFTNGHQAKAKQINTPIKEDSTWVMTNLRASYHHLSLTQYKAAGKAFQIVYWDDHSRFCPVCGSSTKQVLDIMKKCPECGHELYPPISTAIIVLVCKEDELLLVKAHNFRGTFYGLVAGFLEAGETLEECVAREVMEETGLRIKNIRYYSSQSWPYPSGLMVGFLADYAGGDIKLQEEELSTAAFFHYKKLPELPQKLSIARQLIDYWLKEKDCGDMYSQTNNYE